MVHRGFITKEKNLLLKIDRVNVHWLETYFFKKRQSVDRETSLRQHK